MHGQNCMYIPIDIQDLFVDKHILLYFKGIFLIYLLNLFYLYSKLILTCWSIHSKSGNMPMEWEFENEELVDLYVSGKSRKFRGLPEHIIQKFFARLQSIEAATSIHDLQTNASMKFKRLSGKKKNMYSVRLNKKWRLEFKINWDDEERTRGYFYITDISNHYED